MVTLDKYILADDVIRGSGWGRGREMVLWVWIISLQDVFEVGMAIAEVEPCLEATIGLLLGDVGREDLVAVAQLILGRVLEVCSIHQGEDNCANSARKKERRCKNMRTQERIRESVLTRSSS